MARLSNLTPNLFGMPYQLPNKVDPRISDISSFFGHHFLQNIVEESPICTIIPGVPEYLPGKNEGDQISTAMALWEQQSSGSAISNFLNNQSSDNFVLYDFKSAYNEYMSYVNVMCRTGATFLGLTDTYNLFDNKKSVDFRTYDWRNYKFNVKANTGFSAGKSIIDLARTMFGEKNRNEDDLLDISTNYNFVQFFVDSDVSPSDSLSNASGESQIKSLFDTGSSYLKELSFMANSGGLENWAEFTSDSATAITGAVSGVLGDSTTLTGAISRIINLGNDVLKGNNIVIPDVYQSSSYSKSYSITVHLKSPYGSKLGYYLNIYVPMMHLLALAVPRLASANSYSSPFIVKAYVDGIFSCNMGLVQSISIQKRNESWNVDGLATEVDVTLDIADLYTSLSMAPQSSPRLFFNNSSMIEYMAINVVYHYINHKF